MYYSPDTIQIFQHNPLDWRPSSFKLKSWTDTITGYIYEANKLSRCLWENRKLMNHDYTWEVAINIEKALAPDKIKDVWTKACRKLRQQQVIGLWIREPSTSNHCNYHLIIKSKISKVELESAIENAMPDRKELPYHKHVDSIKSQWHFTRYITKAKTTGYLNGELVDDKYKDKRLLLRAKLNLRKVGTIGTFWEQPRKQIWQKIIDVEKRIADGLEQPNIAGLVDHLCDWLPGISVKRVQRSIGFHANAPATKEWASKLEQSYIDNHDDNSELLTNVTAVDNQNDADTNANNGGSPFTYVGRYMARFCVTLLHWCGSFYRRRPSRLSSHPP